MSLVTWLQRFFLFSLGFFVSTFIYSVYLTRTAADARLALLGDVVDSLQDETQQLSKDIQPLNSALESSKKKVKDLELANSVLKNDVSELTQQFIVLKQQIDEINQTTHKKLSLLLSKTITKREIEEIGTRKTKDIKEIKIKEIKIKETTKKIRSPKDDIAVIIFCFNRGRSLQRTLDSLFRYRPKEGFPIFVSQDGNHEEVTRVINGFSGKLTHLKFTYMQPNEPIPNHWSGYYRISEHYRFGLTQIFDVYKHETLILLEDDMDVAPDFFLYFENMRTVLLKDPTLYCVSAWNDNGQAQHVQDPRQFYRSECFPGLGWMLLRSLWDKEFRAKWPFRFWDEWIRLPEHRRGRSCIYPEVNRVYTFGNDGTSGGEFFNTYLEPIKLNTETIDYNTIDLSLLEKENYDVYIISLLQSARILESYPNLLQLPMTTEGGTVAVYYDSLDELTQWENGFQLMSNHKEGVPRASYMGIVPFRHSGYRVLFAPKSLQQTITESVRVL